MKSFRYSISGIFFLSGIMAFIFSFSTSCQEEDSMVFTKPWTDDATRIVNDLVFMQVNGTNFFGIGYDVNATGPWDGVTAPRGCSVNPVTGVLGNASEMSQLAVDAGANFAYVWSYSALGFNNSETVMATNPQIYGRWTPGWGVSAKGKGYHSCHGQWIWGSRFWRRITGRAFKGHGGF